LERVTEQLCESRGRGLQGGESLCEERDGCERRLSCEVRQQDTQNTAMSLPGGDPTQPHNFSSAYSF